MYHADAEAHRYTRNSFVISYGFKRIRKLSILIVLVLKVLQGICPAETAGSELDRTV